MNNNEYNNDDNMNNDINNQIWTRIKNVASVREMSMMGLSLKLGKSQNYINKMLTESRKIPCSLLCEIAKALDVPAEYLLTGNASVFDNERMLRSMVMFVASDENLLTQSELRLIYSTMLDMIEKHHNAVGAMRRIKREEADSAYENKFDDIAYDETEPHKTIFIPIPNAGDKGKTKPKK